VSLLALAWASAAVAQDQGEAPQTTAAPPLAEPTSADDRLRVLEAELEALRAQVADLKASTIAQVGALRTEQQATTVSLANGRPTIATGDGQFTAAFRGVFQFDTAIYDQDSAGPLATDFRRGSFNDANENDRARDLNDGTNFRRARLGIEGKAFGAFDYNFLYDFGGSGTEEAGKISSAWLQYTLPTKTPIRLRVGAFAPTTGLEDATSSNSGLFIERASVAETVRGLVGGDGRTAIGFFSNGERWTASGAVTGNVVATTTFDEQLGVTGRFSFLPYKGYESLIHLGVNANIIVEPAAGGPDVPGGATRNVRLRDRPEVRVDGTRLIDTNNIDADGANAYGLEFAAQRKNLYLAAEYFKIDVERRTGSLPDPDFSGWYVQGSWILTGEARRYTTAAGGFDGPRPAKPFHYKEGTWGAWELAFRYSDFDLNYREGSPSFQPVGSIRGGEQKIWSLGVNWYLNNAVTLSGSFRHVDVDRLSPGGSAFVAGSTPAAGVQVGQELNIWTLRTQYAF
jgi:phosphate-selective porin OprO and OprP